MKRYLLIVVATLTLLLGLPAGLLAQGDSATEKEVRDALEKYRTALMQRDAAALKQIWAALKPT